MIISMRLVTKNRNRSVAAAARYPSTAKLKSLRFDPKLEVLLRLFGDRGIAPDRRVGAVAPASRAIEGVHPDAVEPLHLADPVRVHPPRMVVGRLAHVGEPVLAVEGLVGDLLGALPGGRLGDAV